MIFKYRTFKMQKKRHKFNGRAHHLSKHEQPPQLFRHIKYFHDMHTVILTKKLLPKKHGYTLMT
jgi:hypothetical protein